jgi:hypothetical protein
MFGALFAMQAAKMGNDRPKWQNLKSWNLMHHIYDNISIWQFPTSYQRLKVARLKTKQ